jgi:HAMP domain-containing protein
LVAVGFAMFLVVNAVLFYWVVRPMRRIAAVADRLSVGEMSADDFPHSGVREVSSLTRSFERMRKSLEKALRLLEQ